MSTGVKGIGGIFFKSPDPQKTKDWYATHLGLKTDAYGTCFGWRNLDDPTKKGYTQWSVISNDRTDHIPENQSFMINYRVENIEALVEQLSQHGVIIVDEITSYDYGKFVHILDEDGLTLELWEPNDEVFETFISGLTR